jgi:hypothetical protein
MTQTKNEMTVVRDKIPCKTGADSMLHRSDFAFCKRGRCNLFPDTFPPF